MVVVKEISDSSDNTFQIPNFSSYEFSSKEIKFIFQRKTYYDDDADGIFDGYHETNNYMVYKGYFRQKGDVISGTFYTATGQFYQYDSGESGSLEELYQLTVDEGFHISDFVAFQNSGEDGRRLLFAGNDQLHGIEKGYAGNDTFHLEYSVSFPLAEPIDGGEGKDTVSFDGAGAPVSVDLLSPASNYVSIEAFVGSRFADHFKGSNQADDLDGAAGDDTLSGRDGNDILRGGRGDDALAGNSGNDVLVGGAGADRLSGGGGIDRASYETARKAVTADLSRPDNNLADAAGDTYSSIECLTGSGYGDRLFGNARENSIAGGGGSDTLDGRAGNDVLRGNSGNDALYGGAGNDRLIGGTGSDRLQGGAGADRFIFTAISESGAASSKRDGIYDFKRSEGDIIDVSAIDANTKLAGNQTFLFIGKAGFHGRAGELRHEKNGDDALVLADVNGDSAADFTVLVAGDTALLKDDFIL